MWSQEIGLVSQFFGVSNWCSSLNVVVRKCGNIRKCTRKQTSAQGWSLKIMVKPNLEFLSEPTQFEFVGPLQLQSFTDPKKLGRSKALLFPVSSFAIQPRESSAKSPNIPGDFGPKIFHKIKGGKKKQTELHTNGSCPKRDAQKTCEMSGCFEGIMLRSLLVKVSFWDPEISWHQLCNEFVALQRWMKKKSL